MIDGNITDALTVTKYVMWDHIVLGQGRTRVDYNVDFYRLFSCSAALTAARRG